MNEKLRGLIKRHPALAASVVEGACSAVETTLCGVLENEVAEEWYDSTTGKTWHGKHVVAMCEEMSAEIAKMAREVLT